ncbi:FHA domain-containing protein [Streptomyces sp. NPDC048257]|uniref:FHA domain-containing protein n=1 Tax=Streptomyces sp. NPDC048257 TaxID=3365526 RepID=UPI0037208229
MSTCPNGHQSASEGWCEFCGYPMAAAANTTAAPSYGYGYGYGYPPAAGEWTAQAELCPQCRTTREATLPFCEVCRYSFPTPASASYTPLAPETDSAAGTRRVGTAPPPPTFSQDHFAAQGSWPTPGNRPADPLPREDHWLLPSGPDQQSHAQHQYYEYPSQQHPHQYYAPPNQVSSHGGGDWSATVGLDRSYFMAMMQHTGPEGAGLSLPEHSPEQYLALSGGQITIGRRRASSGESPDIDLSVPPEDPGVSHQQAMLVQRSDGTWAVMDQNSTNGTTINGSEEPIQPYVPIPLDDGDQVHVGAWTTITVRRR